MLFELDKDWFRQNLSKYTIKAFRMLPKMDKPVILDIGCGTGVPTLELARLSNGHIVAIDIDQSLIKILDLKIEKAGLSNRIKTIIRSMKDIKFKNESFDLIWSEGSIKPIGFKNALTCWRKFIKNNGYLVIHDELRNYKETITTIEECKYQMVGNFTLSEQVWWTEYYAPIERQIAALNKIRILNNNHELFSSQEEIAKFKKNPELFRSVFYILRKPIE